MTCQDSHLSDQNLPTAGMTEVPSLGNQPLGCYYNLHSAGGPAAFGQLVWVFFSCSSVSSFWAKLRRNL